MAIYDAEASLDYRQHDGNLIGANASFKDRVTRFRKMLSGRVCRMECCKPADIEGHDPSADAGKQSHAGAFRERPTPRCPRAAL